MLGGMSAHPEADREQLLADLDRATAAFAQLVDATGPEWLTAPTPCPDVDVRTLIEHLIDGSWFFAELLTGSADTERAKTPDSLPAAFLAASGQMLTAFAAPGRLDLDFDSPVGRSSGTRLAKVRLIELVGHGWDLASATGRPMTAFPADLCERTLAIARELFTDQRARFGPPQPVPETAIAADKLAAFLGRPA